MRIVADEQIPCVRELFEGRAEVLLLPGEAITSEVVQTADVLLVRSVTKVDRTLLQGSRVRFVGSTTSGIDHVDRAYLELAGIAFAYAPGSNARSVVEYVLAALYALAVRTGRNPADSTVGVVGCGQIGGRLVRRLEALGIRVLKNDPPLADAAARRGIPHDFVGLDVLLREADVLTFHVPLTGEGPYATYHLMDEARLMELRPGTWLINTARGPVVDNRALYKRLEWKQDLEVVLDVWEGEPAIDEALLRRVALGTPHIAGYSLDGKLAGIRMVYEALCRVMGWAFSWPESCQIRRREWLKVSSVRCTPEDLHACIRQAYDIEADDRALRRMLSLPEAERAAYFQTLRRTYPLRLEFDHYCLEASAVDPGCRERLCRGLGFCLEADQRTVSEGEAQA